MQVQHAEDWFMGSDGLHPCQCKERQTAAVLDKEGAPLDRTTSTLSRRKVRWHTAYDRSPRRKGKLSRSSVVMLYSWAKVSQASSVGAKKV